MNAPNQAMSQLAYEARFVADLNAGLYTRGVLPTPIQPAVQQSEDPGTGPHAAEPDATEAQSSGRSMENAPNDSTHLRPAAELPTEEVYASVQDLTEAVNAYGLRTGCDLIKRAHKVTAKGQPPYRWMMRCARFGSPSANTPTIRKNTRSKKCDCPFGFWVIALDRMNPATSQYRIKLSEGHTQHNHDPATTIAALQNARRRIRRQPEVDARRQELLQSGAKPARVVEQMMLTHDNVHVTARDIHNDRLRDRTYASEGRPLSYNASRNEGQSLPQTDSRRDGNSLSLAEDITGLRAQIMGMLRSLSPTAYPLTFT